MQEYEITIKLRLVALTNIGLQRAGILTSKPIEDAVKAIGTSAPDVAIILHSAEIVDVPPPLPKEPA